MSSTVTTLWNEERSAGFRRLSGSQVSGVVPIRESLIQLLVATRPRSATLQDLQVRLRAGNHLSVQALVRVFGFSKQLEMTFRIAPSIDPNPPRRLHLFFADRSILTSVMGFAGPFLPDWVLRHDSGLVVDLERLAARAGAGDLLQHVGRVAFEGQEGVLWVNFEAGIASADGHATTPIPSASPGAESVGRGGFRADELVPLLAGSRLAIRLRVEESLVNAAIGVLAEGTRDSQATDGQVDWRAMVDFPSAPRVNFEAGAVVIEGALQLTGGERRRE